MINIYGVPGLVSAAWDLTSFLTNAKTQIENWGGLLLMLLGVVGLVWGGVLIIKKLMSGPQGGQQQSWGTIILLILVGGAMMTGGFSLLGTIGSGGQQTIEDLGGGTMLITQMLSPMLLTGIFG